MGTETSEGCVALSQGPRVTQILKNTRKRFSPGVSGRIQHHTQLHPREPTLDTDFQTREGITWVVSEATELVLIQHSINRPVAQSQSATPCGSQHPELVPREDQSGRGPL